MIRYVAPGLWIFAVIACGSGKQPAPSGAQPVGSGSAVAVPAGSGSGPGSAAPAVEPLSSTAGEGLAAAGTAAAFIHAVMKRDWAGACATRLRSEQQKLATIGGSCERGIEMLFAKQPVEKLASATTGGVRKRGDTIAVDIVQPGQAGPAMTLFLRREDGLWLLVDLPHTEAF